MSSGGARPTVRDVAAVAGVSPTTVSHALNGKGRVDSRTRRRVEDAATRIGYRANPVARNLRAGRTGMLSLVLPTIGHDATTNEALALDYYMRLASAAAAAAFAHEYALLLPPPLRSGADLRDLPIDGGILADPEMNDPRLSMFRALNLPVVTIERDLGDDDDAGASSSDNDANTRIVLDHLAQGARDGSRCSYPMYASRGSRRRRRRSSPGPRATGARPSSSRWHTSTSRAAPTPARCNCSTGQIDPTPSSRSPRGTPRARCGRHANVGCASHAT